MKVYQSINNVQAALSKIGITKDGRNTQGQGYNFRGIDQVYNTLSPLLAENGLCILPRVVKSEQTERMSAKGSALIYSYVTMEFDLVSAEDGSKHTVCTVGEAFDSGDKSMNKAMSAAYKYAAFQTFAIPTEGDNDADAHTHEVAAKKVIKQGAKNGIGDDLPQEWKDYLISLAQQVTAYTLAGKAEKAKQVIEEAKVNDDLDGDMLIFMDRHLDSKVRSALRKVEAVTA